MNGEQYKRLHEALVAAFPDANSLRRMVRFGLDQNLDAVADTSTLNDAVFELLRWADSTNRIDHLIIAARNSNPGNSMLREIAEDLKLAADSRELESIVIQSVGFNDVAAWRYKMSKSELAVCRVEMGLKSGTAFLIGADLIITNYHVVKDAISGKFEPDKIVARFDYKTDIRGIAVQDGEEYRFARSWLIDSSPDDELDYALIRVEGNPGEMRVASQSDAPTRGWLVPVAHDFTPGETLLIIQHPERMPLKLSAGTFLRSKLSPPRIIHNVSTLGGSSGSPSFTSDWQPVALHNGGSPTENEAVPFSAILRELKSKGIEF
jgi:Effector-associated domain 1/Trypsin-like peptidase domain